MSDVDTAGGKIKWGEGNVAEKLNPDIRPQILVQSPDFFRSSIGGVKNENVGGVVTAGEYKVALVNNNTTVVAIDNSGLMVELPESLVPESTASLRAILRTIRISHGQVVLTGPCQENSTVASLESRLEKAGGVEAEQARDIGIGCVKTLQKTGVKFSSTENHGLWIATSQLTDESLGACSGLPLNGASLKVANGEGNSVIIVVPQAEKVALVKTNGQVSEWSRVDYEEGGAELGVVSETASGFKVIKRVGEKARIVDGSGRQKIVLPSEQASVDPEDNNTIWYVENGKVMSIDAEKMAAGIMKSEEATLPEGVTGCESVCIDPNGNFLAIKHGEKLTVVVKSTMQPVDTVEGVAGSVIVDDDGNITYIDNNKQLRQITTNFNSFPNGFGAVVAERQTKVAEALAEATRNLVFPEVDLEGAFAESRAPGTESPKADAIDQAVYGLSQKLESMFGELIGQAGSEEEVRKLQLQLRAIQDKPEFNQYPLAGETVRRAIDIRMAQVQAEKLGEGIAGIGSQLGVVNTLEGSLALTTELTRIQDLRKRVNFMLLNPEQATSLRQHLGELESMVQEINGRYQGELVTQLKTVATEELGGMLVSAGTTMELEAIGSDPAVTRFLSRVNMILDPKARAEVRRMYAGAIEKRQAEIEKTLSTREEGKRMAATEVAKEIEAGFRKLSQRVTAVLQESRGGANLVAFAQGSTTVQELRQQIGQLPPEYQAQYLARIEEAMEQAKRAFQVGKMETKRDVETKGATVSFGNEAFPVYLPPLVSITPGWIAKNKDQTGREDFGEVVFEVEKNGERAVWRTGKVMRMNEDTPQRKRDFQDLERRAKAKYDPPREVPKVPSELVLTPYQEQVLEKMTKYFRQQLGLNRNLVQTSEPKGILIIQGDAGAGKDFNLDVWAAAVGYEHVKIPCSFTMDPTDLTSEFRFDPKKGTYRVPSKFVQAIQKPGVLVNMVEINTLPPGLTKMLNTLFDYQRTLYITQGEDPESFEISDKPGKNSREIRVGKGTVIAGTMNYANYQGTRPLSLEFLSRSRVMDVDYPPYRVATDSSGKERRLGVEQTSIPAGMRDMKVRSDEAMILARQMESLRSLTPQEFGRLWDHVINQVAGNGADILDNSERRKAINQLNDVVRTANKMRQSYRAFQMNEPGAPVFEFVFSMRESDAIVKELSEGGSPKEAIAEVVLPKIADPTQKKMAQALIDSA